MAVPPQGAPSDGDGTSLERGLRVLLAVSDRGSVRVDSLVEQVGVPASTVYRYLRTLRDLGLVEETDGWYQPGERLGKHRTNRLQRHSAPRLAKPILRALAAETGETALITVRAGHGRSVRGAGGVAEPHADGVRDRPGAAPAGGSRLSRACSPTHPRT